MTARVRLHDGTETTSDSEAWRHECEARAIAKLPTRVERDAWLAAIAVKRGDVAAQALRETMQQLIGKRQGATG